MFSISESDHVAARSLHDAQGSLLFAVFFLQVLLLPASSCVLVQMPLYIAFLVIQGTCSNFKQTHAHPGAHFGQLDGLITCLDENVMSDFDCVFDVFESKS